MAKIKWTPQSLDDIEAISNFIARDSDYYAGIFTEDFMAERNQPKDKKRRLF